MGGRPGIRNGAVPPWPLLTEGTTDYFNGVPVAVFQRGGQMIGRLMGKNWIVGGIMGPGKTSIVVALLLGAILDPLVIAEVYVMATDVDYDPLRPLEGPSVGGGVVAGQQCAVSCRVKSSRLRDAADRGADPPATRELVGHAAVISPAQPRGLITGHAGQ
ncbi:hypothetical protein [Streptomyces sp. NPDC001714]|uniref:hypothetical protein n=1 Tax=Streptomyces sp. NPDC001714 TaxID=3364603 RepID=UPI0036A60E2A